MSLQTTLNEIFGPVASELEGVEAALSQRLAAIVESHTLSNRYSKSSDSIISYLLNAPGKRLRPAMMLLSAHAAVAATPTSAHAPTPVPAQVGGRTGHRTPFEVSDAAPRDLLPTRQLVDLAAGVELIHSASLIHDDVLDGAWFRRGRLSLNARFGNKLAVLAGDVLFTDFYRLVSELPGVAAGLRLRLLGLFTDVTRKMCFGEMYEERIRHERRRVGFDDYLDLIENKTASLMSACCEAGALLCANETPARTLSRFGRELGIAYQLRDDLSDGDAIFGDRDRLASEAEAHTAEAVAALCELPESVAREKLFELVGLIRDRM